MGETRLVTIWQRLKLSRVYLGIQSTILFLRMPEIFESIFTNLVVVGKAVQENLSTLTSHHEQKLIKNGLMGEKNGLMI